MTAMNKLTYIAKCAARPLSIQKQMWKLVEGTDKEDFVAIRFKVIE